MSIVEPSVHTLEDGRKVTIRSARPNDAVRLIESAAAMLVDNTFAIREADEFTYTPEEESRLIEEHGRLPGKLWLVAEADGAIVGSTMFSVGRFRRVAHCGSLGISLDAGWRGQGLGNLLLSLLLDWAEQEPGVEKVALAVFADNEPALRLYRKLGFVEEGRRQCEVRLGPGRYVDDVLMYRWVKGGAGGRETAQIHPS